ncbi:MAG: cell division protein FtsX [Micavibrio sp.]|nr:cell division protein FtsX [Micavibrio sp.]
MSEHVDAFTKRRLRSSYISVIVSISLVLFVLGVFGNLLINAEAIARQVKENFAVTVLLSEDAPEIEVKQFQKSLDLAPYVKSTEFISKEEAASELKEELDEDFVDFLGYNPLSNAIDIRLKAEYVTPEQLTFMESEFTKKSFVQEVVYDKPLIQLMNENIRKISLILIGGTLLLLLVAVGLINSSIRLSIYSRRFLIKTMQLVGATKSFIRKPFMLKSLRHGFIGAVLASALLMVLIYYVGQEIPDFAELQSPLKLGAIILGLILTGLVLSFLSTYFALRKYLKLKTDQLYF